MARGSRRNRRSRGGNRKSRSSNRRSRGGNRRSRRRSKSRQNGGSAGFGAVLKEAIVPIAFLGTNIKLKKGHFGNKKVMIPIFKDMHAAKMARDGKSRRKRRRRKAKGTKKRR